MAENKIDKPGRHVTTSYGGAVNKAARCNLDNVRSLVNARSSSSIEQRAQSIAQMLHPLMLVARGPLKRGAGRSKGSGGSDSHCLLL